MPTPPASLTARPYSCSMKERHVFSACPPPVSPPASTPLDMLSKACDSMTASNSRAAFIARSGDCDACCVREWVIPSRAVVARSEEHTSELQSLMRISYAVFCLKKKKNANLRISEYEDDFVD